MLRYEIEECKEIARLIAREEIAKALADFQKPVEPVAEKKTKPLYQKP
jgi:hypothetical protein